MEITPVTTAARSRKVQAAKAAGPKSGKASASKPAITAKAAAKPKPEITTKALTKTKVLAKAEAVASPTPTKRKPAVKKPTAGDLVQKIAMAAYFMAEQRHFVPGHELQDWLAAEKLVRAGQTGQ